MHIDVHTSPPVTESKDHITWAVTNDVELEASIPELLKELEKRKFVDKGMAPEDFKIAYVLAPAEKPNGEDLDYQEVKGSKPIPWLSIAEGPSFFSNRHLFLRKMTFQDEKYLADPDQSPGVLPDEPPPPLQPGVPIAAETGIGTSTFDIPKYNEVQVSGQLPLQHLKISALSWKSRPVRPTPGIRNRPLSTATMCPSCGKPFAMNIPDDLMKKKMLTTDMERELDNALEAQRAVLEGEKKMLENEASDLKAALASINASLSRTRDDGEELAQLSEQQSSWTKWLEGEIRQTKAEINQLGADFDNCLKSNDQLTGLVEQAISKKVESKYWNKNVAQRTSALHAGAPVPAQQIAYPPHGPGVNTVPLPLPSNATTRKERVRELVVRYYQRHNPAKVGLVDTLVDEYEGKERELLSLMAQKYGDASILAYDPLIDDASVSHRTETALPQSSSGFTGDLGPVDVNEYLRDRSPKSKGRTPRDESQADRRIQELLGDFLSDGKPSPARQSGGLSAYPSGGNSNFTNPVSDPSRVTFNLPPGNAQTPASGYHPSSSYTQSPGFTDPRSEAALQEELMRIAPTTMENRSRRS